MLIERTMHPSWLSNAYLVADEPGGTGVFVDSGAPLEPLLQAVERERLTVTHLLTTHGDPDHVAGHDELRRRFDLQVLAHPAERVDGAEPFRGGETLELGGLRVEALDTPGHSPGHLAFVVNGEVCFSADVLFRDSVGGTKDAYDDVRRSVMDVLMSLPHDLRVLPGHTEPTTIGREWNENPIIRVWRGLDPEGSEPCRVGGREATLVAWSPDYDGKGKAWVHFAGGRNMIVGGSSIERTVPS